MPNIMADPQINTLTVASMNRVKPAVRSAYGSMLDPDGQVADAMLVQMAVRQHLQNLVNDYERAQAEAAISVPDLD